MAHDIGREEIEKDIKIDEAIENIFRTIHQKIMSIKIEYDNIIQRGLPESDAKADLTLKSFHSTISKLSSSLATELYNIRRKTVSIQEPAKSTVRYILSNITYIEDWLKEYDKSLEIFGLMVSQDSNERIRGEINNQYDKLTTIYNKVFDKDNEVIKELKLLENQIPKRPAA